MLDVILYSLGSALLLGQAVYFYVFDDAVVEAPYARSVFPTAGAAWHETDRSAATASGVELH